MTSPRPAFVRAGLLVLAAVAPSLLLLACPADSGACDCIPAQSSGEPQSPSCGERICDPLYATDDSPGQPKAVSNPEAVTCALEALRDRSPGIIMWEVSQFEGQYTQEGYIMIHDDGTAVRRSFGYEDLAFSADPAEHGELPAAGDYEACLAETDEAARFDCVTRGLASVSESCDQGWFDESV